LRERKRERAHALAGGGTEGQADFLLSMEPDEELDPRPLRSLPELKSDG